MTREELKKLAEMSATPIDFDRLIEGKVIEKRGVWYALLDPERLPEHAQRKINQIKSPNLVKFAKHKPELKSTFD